METQRSKKASLLMWALVAALLSQDLVSTVLSDASFEDQKTYYAPPTDPHSGTPPSGSHHHTPSHGGSHRTPSGGGSHGGTPPTNCGTPPSPHYEPSPAPPTGGGGYHYSPPTVTPTPSTPTITPIIPSPPTIITPPTTPIDPGTPSIPGISIPSPPFSVPTPPFSIPSPPFSIPTPPFDPNSPPFTCDYWRTHPGLIWGVLGFWGTTVTGAFGVSSLPGLGSHLSLEQALSSTRTDGLGSLYREGTASLLNSMIHTTFPFTPTQVRENFISALGSNKAAAAQARVFKLANEGRLKPRT